MSKHGEKNAPGSRGADGVEQLYRAKLAGAVELTDRLHQWFEDGCSEAPERGLCVLGGGDVVGVEISDERRNRLRPRGHAGSIAPRRGCRSRVRDRPSRCRTSEATTVGTART